MISCANSRLSIVRAFLACATAFAIAPAAFAQQVSLEWTPLSPGNERVSESREARAGAFIGVHEDVLLVAGGIGWSAESADAQRQEGVGDTYLDAIAVATRGTSTQGNDGGDISATERMLIWREAAVTLPSPRAFGASASHASGVVAVGGTDGRNNFNDVFLLRWSDTAGKVQRFTLPPIPRDVVNGAAEFIGDVLYVLVGAASHESAGAFYALDLSQMVTDAEGNPIVDNGIVRMNANTAIDRAVWRELDAGPFAKGANSTRANVILVGQNDGREDVLFVLGGHDNADSAAYFSSLWQYRPAADYDHWTRFSDIEVDRQRVQLGRGSAAAIGQSHIWVIAESERRTVTLSYNAITKAWAQYPITAPQMDTHAVPITSSVKLVSASIENLGTDTVVHIALQDKSSRSATWWAVNFASPATAFGWQNMTVLIVYLLAMVMVGVYFASRNKDVNDYFRGGQSIPWWAAACSMYATMLSSLTYVGMPALVYRTDWVFYVGVWMILAVAPIAAYIAMPFFRQIDATSAYEYLSRRFNLSVRLFASGLFTLFHISRMGIVLALTALALAAVTPFDAWHCVLIMGVLSLLYSTMGGIEAVIWSDTIQTVVLIVGAIVCFAFIVNGVDGGVSGIITQGMADDKFKMLKLDFGPDSITRLSLWVIVIGGLGQNLSSYTADQAVVQRYMTTKDVQAATKSIWTNGIMAPAVSVLFFIIGTGLYVFYQSNPGRLDPTKQLDQIFPVFISTELPIGIAGLIIAGIFAAAQSTVSTSMNSIATTVVTDFMRPFDVCRTEHAYLNAARWLTFIVGAMGTLAGLIFISPEIRSLMEEYFKVVGMFMGALGGLFILGVISTKANGTGAMLGLLSGAGVMLLVWTLELADGYLFATIGILTCLCVGYIASTLTGTSGSQDLQGLTIHTLHRSS